MAEVADAPTTVFLSYSRADRAIAERLANALKVRGCDVWWDALIEGGAVFTKSIETALDAADAVVVLWSKTSIQSDWVRDEAGRGRDRKRLVPVAIDGSEPPLGFRQYHAIDFSKWRGTPSSDELAALLHGIAAAAGQAAPSVDPPKPARFAIGRRALIGGGAAALVAGGGLIVWRGGWIGTAEATTSSIAVMPFENLSGGDDQRYFSEGLTSDVRAALARNEQLQVLAAASSEAAQDKKWDAVTAARNLGVGFLLEGSVRRNGDVVRIAADLIDGKTGFSRWSSSFDRKMADVFAVQSEIARIVTNALLATIGTIAPPPGGTTDVPAYEAFLKGRALFFNGSGDDASDRAALALFDSAISADPKFADAYAMRARSLSLIAAEHAKGPEVGSLQAAAVVAAKQAVELAPDMASGHLALGNAVFNGDKNVRGAKGSYDRAYALGRGDANLVLAYALYCARDGRAKEAHDAVQRAIVLDPLNPRTYRAAGSIAYAARQYQQAIPPLEQALSINPKLPNTSFYIGNSHYMLGRYAAARSAFLAEPSAMFRHYGAAISEHRLGNDTAAKAALARLVSEVGDSALYQQAEVLAQWGDLDGALTALERARIVGDSGLTYLKVDPMVDPLRQSPRFMALYKTLNFS